MMVDPKTSRGFGGAGEAISRGVISRISMELVLP